MMLNTNVEVNGLGFRLVNQNSPSKTLHINRPTWFGILDMAVEHGWCPMGTAEPDWWMKSGEDLSFLHGETCCGGYTDGSRGLVLLEDALNLADALENAIVDYEPEWLRFEEWGGISYSGALFPSRLGTPSLGALSCLMDFCRMGPFQIEHLQ